MTDPGIPLEHASRAATEDVLRRDLGHVRVHVDANAGETATSLGARAMTYGHHVVFGRAQFDPTSHAGRTLIAHELTHVAQQSPAPAAPPARIGAPDSTPERQATEVANGRGRADVGFHLAAVPAGTISFDPDPAAGATYPTPEQQQDIQTVLNPVQSEATAAHQEVPPVSDPKGFRQAMHDRLLDYIDNQVLPGAKQIAAAPVAISDANLASLGQVAEREVNRRFGAYAHALPPTFKLAAHLHTVPDSLPAADLKGAVRSWVASRMHAVGGTLLTSHNVLASSGGEPARDQTLFDDTRDDIIKDRRSAIETIVLHAPGYETSDKEAFIQARQPIGAGQTKDDAARTARWRAFGTALHEMMHQLASPAFTTAAQGLEESGIAIEGFAEFFAEEVYRDIQSSDDPKLRAEIEGSPPSPSAPAPPERKASTYARYVTAVQQIKDILGGNEENLRAAFFAGRVDLIGLGGWTAEEAKRRQAAGQPGNVLSAAVALNFGATPTSFVQARYGRIVYGRGGDLQLNLGAGINYLSSGGRIGLTGNVGLRYSWPNVFVEAGVGLGGSIGTGAPGERAVRLDVLPEFRAGVIIGAFQIGPNLVILAPVGGPVPERNVQLLGGLGLSAKF